MWAKIQQICQILKVFYLIDCTDTFVAILCSNKSKQITELFLSQGRVTRQFQPKYECKPTLIYMLQSNKRLQLNFIHINIHDLAVNKWRVTKHIQTYFYSNCMSFQHFFYPRKNISLQRFKEFWTLLGLTGY